jgi:hypothetical protein
MDGFEPTLAPFLEWLENNSAEEREWMTVASIGAILEYDKPSGGIRRAGGVASVRDSTVHGSSAGGKVRLAARRDDDRAMNLPAVTASPEPVGAEAGRAPPVALARALELAFAMLAFTLRRPTRKASAHARRRDSRTGSQGQGLHARPQRAYGNRSSASPTRIWNTCQSPCTTSRPSRAACVLVLYCMPLPPLRSVCFRFRFK